MSRIVEHGKERYAFDRFIQVGREAGFIADKVTLLTDTTSVKGAGAVQNTYTLLRKGIRKLLRAMGYQLPGKRRGLSEQAKQLIATYLEQDQKADIDWSDAAQRQEQLGVLVDDAEALLEWALAHSDDATVRQIGWLLTKILGDDVVIDEQGNPQIGEGTAPDRIISLTEPEMRHGRKSSAHRFDGFKVLVSTDQSSELILDIADITAMGSDGAQLMPTIERVETETEVVIERAIGDGAFGSGKNRAACANYDTHPVDLVSPLSRARDPEVDKSAFQIDLVTKMTTCPRGHTAEGRVGSRQDGRPTMRFTFSRAACEACDLFERCVRSKKAGRSVNTHPYETHLQHARQRQQTEEFMILYRLRAAVERKIAELVGHGLRLTRYVGQPKRQLQRLWIAAAANLKRLFTLAQAQRVDLCMLLGGLDPPRVGRMPA